MIVANAHQSAVPQSPICPPPLCSIRATAIVASTIAIGAAASDPPTARLFRISEIRGMSNSRRSSRRGRKTGTTTIRTSAQWASRNRRRFSASQILTARSTAKNTQMTMSPMRNQRSTASESSLTYGPTISGTIAAASANRNGSVRLSHRARSSSFLAVVRDRFSCRVSQLSTSFTECLLSSVPRRSGRLRRSPRLRLWRYRPGRCRE